MPPAKARPPPEDSRSEASSTKEKVTSSILPPNGKSRRTGAGGAGGSSLRDVMNVGSNAATTGAAVPSNPETGPGIQWADFDSDVLHGYRHSYRLNTPAAFSNTYNQIVLSRSPIGRMSPTMARRKEERKQSKEQLANAVRKHFNGLGINENEVVVDFLYKVRWQDKNFRMRFAPQNPKSR